MEAQDRKPAPLLMRQLESHPRDFSFYQALRVLRFTHQWEDGDKADMFALFRRHVRVRPLLSLGFPSVDIHGIENFPAPTENAATEAYVDSAATQPLWQLTVTFLGLYGTSSPLPAFYTEDLITDYVQGMEVNRDLTDVVNQPFYELLWLCWRRYRVALRIVEEGDSACFRKLWALGGKDPDLLQQKGLYAEYNLRRLALYAQHPRSEQAVTTLLRDVLNIDAIRIRPLKMRAKPLPYSQRCRMGIANSQLGDDCVVGSAIQDCNSAFDLDIGPVDMNTYRSLLPGGELHKKMRWYLNDFLDQPLDFMLNLFLKKDEDRSARLQPDAWGSLGEDMWLQPSATALAKAQTKRGAKRISRKQEGDTARPEAHITQTPLVSFFIAHEQTRTA